MSLIINDFFFAIGPNTFWLSTDGIPPVSSGVQFRYTHPFSIYLLLINITGDCAPAPFELPNNHGEESLPTIVRDFSSAHRVGQGYATKEKSTSHSKEGHN